MQDRLDLHSLPFLVVALLIFFIPLAVFLKNRRSALNRNFFILAATSALWQVSFFFAFNNEDPFIIMWWCRLAYVGIAFITAATYHFVSSLLNLRKIRPVLIAYLFASFSAYLILRTDLIISGLRSFQWGNYPMAGPLHSIFLVIWFVPFFASLLYLFREYKSASSSFNKTRIKYFLISLPIVYLGTVDFLPAYGLNVYPWGSFPVLFFCLLTTYGVLRYRVLDIEIIIKKASLAGLGIAASISALYFGTFYLQRYFYVLGGKDWVLFPILISFLVGLALFRFLDLVRNMQEDELSRRFAYRPLLEKEIMRMSLATNLNELLAFVTRDLSNWIRLDYVGIFILDETANRFILSRSLTRSKKVKKVPLELSLAQESPLVAELLRRRTPLIRSELEYYFKVRMDTLKERDFMADLLGQMQKFGAEVAIPVYCEGRLIAIVNIGHKLDTGGMISPEDLRILNSLTGQFGRVVYDFMLKREKIRLIVASQNALISAIESKDSYTKGHTERVARYALMVGNNLALLSRNFSYELKNLEWCAQLHDVGKIGISDNILLKVDPLTEHDWAKIREHTLSGVKIIAAVREWLGEDICAGILQHHENYDGSGYPSHIKAEDIHIFARIIRVVDSFDAMVIDRPYRAALTKKDAMDELKKHKGSLYDPVIVDVVEYLYNKGEI